MPRKLRVQYRSEDSFRREYAQNIAKGGIFVPTRHQIEMRERVEIELVLAFADQSVILAGEVVHCIPPEMAETGAQPGVAIQFLLEGDELRSKLELYAGPVATHVDERVQGTGRRVAPRSRAHVAADVEIDGAWIEGHTRNVSTSGVLIALPGEPPPIGCRVKVRIKLPSGGDQMNVSGQIARHLEAGSVTCVGIHFTVPEARVAEVSEFMNRMRAVEHSRRLGGINGPIAELGIRSILSMFGSSAPKGMLTVERGTQEGYITIDQGVLRAQVGLLTGREALDSMLAWGEGNFTFEGQTDDALVSGDRIPIAEALGDTALPTPPAAGSVESPEAAVDPEEDDLVLMDLDDLESSAQPELDIGEGGIDLDEEDFTLDDDADGAGFEPDDDHSLGRFVLDDDEADALEERVRGELSAPISPEATLVASGAGDRSDLSKTQEALLDLAAVGMTVAKVIEIIPEADAEIYSALQNLIDEGFLTLE